MENDEVTTAQILFPDDQERKNHAWTTRDESHISNF